jgi:hypothetical protein
LATAQKNKKTLVVFGELTLVEFVMESSDGCKKNMASREETCDDLGHSELAGQGSQINQAIMYILTKC